MFDTSAQVSCIKYDNAATLGLLSQISDNKIALFLRHTTCLSRSLGPHSPLVPWGWGGVWAFPLLVPVGGPGPHSPLVPWESGASLSSGPSGSGSRPSLSLFPLGGGVVVAGPSLSLPLCGGGSGPLLSWSLWGPGPSLSSGPSGGPGPPQCIMGKVTWDPLPLNRLMDKHD